VPEKLVSVFGPRTEVIRRGKASKPTEFGKMVKIQEAENQVVTDHEVFPKRPSDSDVLVPAVERHQEQFGQVPKLGRATRSSTPRATSRNWERWV
jgi:IS5 family transposase